MGHRDTGDAHVDGPRQRAAQSSFQARALLATPETEGVEQEIEADFRIAAVINVSRELTPRDRRRDGARPPVPQGSLIAGPEELVHVEAF
jgi:hypothetical protein